MMLTLQKKLEKQCLRNENKEFLILAQKEFNWQYPDKVWHKTTGKKPKVERDVCFKS